MLLIFKYTVMKYYVHKILNEILQLDKYLPTYYNLVIKKHNVQSKIYIILSKKT